MSAWLPVVVSNVQPQGKDITGIELAPIQGTTLPAWTPGSHIQVQLDSGLVRAYSLCNRPDERGVYHLAVKREPDSRGGSEAMAALTAGQRLNISPPVNAFALDPAAPAHVLIAGGIGITPVRAMYFSLLAQGKPAELHYFVRSEAHAAFLSDIQAAGAQIYTGLDATWTFSRLTDIITTLPDGAALYACGPAALLDAVNTIASSQRIDAGRLHQERFAPASSQTTPGAATPGATGADPATERTFDVEFAKTGVTRQVTPGKSIVDAATEAGITIPTSCGMGICGSCQSPVLSGTPDHADQVLSDAERQRNDTIIPCISRCHSERLVLDL